LEEDIFLCMEYSKQGYLDTMNMPIGRFRNYLKWKIKLEDKKKELMQDELDKNNKK
jgi:hypothetical protein